MLWVGLSSRRVWRVEGAESTQGLGASDWEPWQLKHREQEARGDLEVPLWPLGGSWIM